MENEVRRYSIPFTTLLFLLSSLVLACGQPALGLPSRTPPEQPPPVTASPPPEQLPPVDEVADGDEWNTIETFTGEGNEITPRFHISGTEWRITLTAAAEYPEYAVLHVLVYPEGTHGICTKRISYSGGSGGDTTYIYEGGQDYHIKVVAANLRSWSIRVEDYATKASLSPVQITRIYYKGLGRRESLEMGYEIVEAEVDWLGMVFTYNTDAVCSIILDEGC